MTNEEKFYKLCDIMAIIEDIITDIEKIGFVVEPGQKGTVSDNLYLSASTAYNLATDLLDFPDVTTENNTANELLAVGSCAMKEVSKKVWEKYGVK